MAAAAKRSGNSKIFWINGDEEQPLVFVPGVDGDVKTQTPFNLGPNGTRTSSKSVTKMRTKHSSVIKNHTTQKTTRKKQNDLQSDGFRAYVKENVSANLSATVPAEQTLFQPPDTFRPLPQVMSETNRAKSEVSLKDLCPEDKRRIANLIEELARVSEEREESVQRLKDEQGNFERKIQQLEQQNLIIAQERESLQQQYKECQELLGLYQQYLSQQQAKLNQSIAQLSQSPAPPKVLSSKEVPSWTSTSRANGSLFDGSYMGLAATGARQAQVHRSGDARRETVQTFRSPASLSCESELSPTDGPVKQHVSQRRECREPHACHRCEHSRGSCHDTGYGTQQERSGSGSCQVNCHHNTFSQKRCDRLHSGNLMGSEAKEGLTRPVLGHEGWEEKRHQLLLQKMHLEMERERLRARLVEQEERLNRQTEQLRQSRLDYSRIQQQAQVELSSSNDRNGGPEPEGPSNQNLPSSVCEDVEVHPAGQTLHEKPSQTVPAPLASKNADHLERSRQDKATSPAKSPAGPSKHTSVSVIQKSPEARSDFSVVELLDIFSPVSASEQCRPGTQRPKTLRHRSVAAAPKSAGRSLLTPSGPYLQSTQQDLEESQILEDIYFIC
ncbi:protein hinderin [Melanotaenia boesemani]|uniref:protein hinderin n=1 Tax=Melanotaenia boesemani TaxID=1250792 RepID=UPI001C053824|nr:protein hinderin [Melanotaenia boesemani]